jgi:eukaryotic-like serine/threonine-protein kinase
MEERFGPWRVERALHLGDWADVVVAVGETDGGVPVALKRLHRHAAREPAAAALFEAEARLVTGLPAHPRLVRGLARGEVDGQPYLAMALVEGSDLRQRAAAADPAGAAAVVLDACAALAHLHGAGWIHGDVGPANLIVDGAGRVTLCDLGVARALGAGGPVRGTHAYMAPEQVRGEAWTAATDVFALGVVLWERAAGARLFRREASFLSMAAVVEADPPPLADAELDAIARAALAKDPAARTPTADALAGAVRALAAARGWPVPPR